MLQFQLTSPITVYTIKADSFPDGVLAAHQQLHQLIAYSDKRKYFGISRPEGKGQIKYYAAAEELEAGELSQHGLPSFIIAAGTYIYIDIPEFMKNIPAIGQSFGKLLTNENIDPNGACVEWYFKQQTCRCMVKLNA